LTKPWGETNAILVMNDVTLSQSGQYSLAISNAAGSRVSEPITLKVNPRPAILTGATFTDLHPAGATMSVALGVHGTNQST
jgi:hypothetical protein